ncbi:hypothetical protein HK100_010187 [Physocladia obscura]|uniref:Uncharacterized protein n=1 Tax=Physocladia obscura TaxID=109957 RepID=A0AAD5T3F5_9FUNG|nr:hypothetical protein HK100_010187 [Physocladia obscura]
MFRIKEGFFLETSELDPRSKTFKTVTRNVSHAKVLLIEETQVVSPCFISSVVERSGEDVEKIPGIDSNITNAYETQGTSIHITAKILQKGSWMAGYSNFGGSLRKKLVDFGVDKIRENTMKSSKALIFVIEDLKRRKLIS